MLCVDELMLFLVFCKKFMIGCLKLHPAHLRRRCNVLWRMWGRRDGWCFENRWEYLKGHIDRSFADKSVLYRCASKGIDNHLHTLQGSFLERWINYWITAVSSRRTGWKTWLSCRWDNIVWRIKISCCGMEIAICRHKCLYGRCLLDEKWWFGWCWLTWTHLF